MKILFSFLINTLSVVVIAQTQKHLSVNTAVCSLTMALSPNSKKMLAYDRTDHISVWNTENGGFSEENINPSAFASDVRFLNNEELLLTRRNQLNNIVFNSKPV